MQEGGWDRSQKVEKTFTAGLAGEFAFAEG